MDSGIESVDEAEARSAARAQARGVVLRSIALATFLTGIAWALP